MDRICISPGNMKIGKIPNFSLPPIRSCPHPEYCTGESEGVKFFCYALKAYRAYPSAKEAWDRNFRIVRRTPCTFYDQMALYLEAKQPQYFRIHVSGDFYSQRYLDIWKQLAAMYPETKFRAFTKAYDLDFSNRPRNLKIGWSIMPDTSLSMIPRGSRAYCGVTPPKIKNLFMCPGSCEDCKHCWYMKHNEHVFFKVH